MATDVVDVRHTDCKHCNGTGQIVLQTAKYNMRTGNMVPFTYRLECRMHLPEPVREVGKTLDELLVGGGYSL